MAGFDNDTMYADNVDFSGSATPVPTVTLDGQLLIGSTAAPNIRVATLIAGANITITNGAGTIQIDATGGGAGTVSGLTPDAFTPPGSSPVIPNGGGNIIVTGAQIPASNLANVIQTNSLAANTMTIEIQVTNSTAVSTPADNGVSHFDSGIFTVGAGGFVSLGGGNVPPAQKFDVDANTGPGTDPVVPTALGVVTITGAQVAAGVVGTNVIRTDSLAANAYTIEVQRTTTAAVSTVADNGVSHFDNTIFTADGNGFISLVGGPVPPTQKFDVDANTVPGTDPVVADGSGVVTVTGAQVASGTVGTNVIRTNSVAANAYRIEIQRSTAVAGTDPTKNGVAHFNSAQFSVDANAFVSIVGTSSLSVVIQAFTSSGTYTPTAGLKYCIVEICGGGGGGGGVSATAAGQVSAAGGGGGGGYSRGVYSNATIGASQVVTIGAGGAGGTSGGGIGSTGGTSSLGALQTASGGGGGNGSIAGATSFENGGGGGLGTLGSINIPGQSGLAGWGIATTLNTVCGAGGASFFGTGGVGSVHTLGTVGGDGGGYGGGGGGAANAPSQVSGHAGGNGTSGVILITEFI
jgi:hypothetical protein